MSLASSTNLNLNIYDEEINEQTTLDCSAQGLADVPDITNKMICVLYLQNNNITSLPDDFFPSLPALMWLDLRDNLLTNIPADIKNHPSLSHLLLQNNKISSLPLELGSVVTLKVLQLDGNPLTFPPKHILNGGAKKTIDYLHQQFIKTIFVKSPLEDTLSVDNFNTSVASYNSVIDEEKLKIHLNEKDSDSDSDEYYGKTKGKCPKLPNCRYKLIPNHQQSSKYLKPLLVGNSFEQMEKIKRNYLKEKATKKHKDRLLLQDKILQDRKNLDQLKNWRQNYRKLQTLSDSSYRMDVKEFPYDTHPDYMTLLNREDIARDLPDKYRKRLVRRCKPSVPRRSNNDVHLALKIKQLFRNLEAIDLNREGLTPRTEQRVLLNEIQKITEIKQKLNELSNNNVRSIVTE